MKVLAVIPARYGSTRFEGKPLVTICGKPMIQWVYEHAAACSLVDEVVVATDHEKIFRAVSDFGGRACMTQAAHTTGTDRVAEAARDSDAGIVVNVQGDEPLLPPAAIREALAPLLEDRTIALGTLKARIHNAADVADPHVVKVVTDTRGFALYFSRSAVPCVRQRGSHVAHYRHIGLYAFTKKFLMQFSQLPPTPLEKAESLEQLRALEHGFAVKVVETVYEPVGVDVPGDIPRVEALMENSGQPGR